MAQKMIFVIFLNDANHGLLGDTGIIFALQTTNGES